MLLPLINQWVIDDVVISGDVSLLVVLVTALFLISVTRMATRMLRGWVLLAASISWNLRSSSSVFQHMVRLPVSFFEKRSIPLALNHCVSLYPSEDHELEMHQIDFLKNRYPDITIGFSTHEYSDWSSSMLIAYAKGARTFERHIDIDDGGIAVSKYCSLPEQVDQWFKAFNKAKEMCGPPSNAKRTPTQREVEYLDGLVRGVYFKTDLPAGHKLKDEDVFLAIPLLHGQLSCRELIAGEELKHDVVANAPLTLDDVDNPYSRNAQLRATIEKRGLPR